MSKFEIGDRTVTFKLRTDANGGRTVVTEWEPDEPKWVTTEEKKLLGQHRNTFLLQRGIDPWGLM